MNELLKILDEFELDIFTEEGFAEHTGGGDFAVLD